MKIILKILSVFILCTIIYSCENSTEPNEVSDENEIREIVLRDQFHNNYSSNNFIYTEDIDTTYKIYFIGFYDEVDSNYQFRGDAIDPDNNFLSRFANFLKKVKKISESEYGFSTGYSVIDKYTKEIGLIFNVGPIKWLSENMVQVEAGYFEASASAGCISYILYKENNEWNIYYKIHRWVS